MFIFSCTAFSASQLTLLQQKSNSASTDFIVISMRVCLSLITSPGVSLCIRLNGAAELSQRLPGVPTYFSQPFSCAAVAVKQFQSCSAAINEWHKGEMWQMVVTETNIHSYQTVTTNENFDSVLFVVVVWAWRSELWSTMTRTFTAISSSSASSRTMLFLSMPRHSDSWSVSLMYWYRLEVKLIQAPSSVDDVLDHWASRWIYHRV